MLQLQTWGPRAWGFLAVYFLVSLLVYTTIQQEMAAYALAKSQCEAMCSSKQCVKNFATGRFDCIDEKLLS